MSMRVGAIVIWAMATSGSATGQAPVQPVERVFVNGKIWTGDPAQPTAEALAIRGDRIVAVGTSDGVK